MLNRALRWTVVGLMVPVLWQAGCLVTEPFGGFFIDDLWGGDFLPVVDGFGYDVVEYVDAFDYEDTYFYDESPYYDESYYYDDGLYYDDGFFW